MLTIKMPETKTITKMPYGWTITFLIFSIFFLILGGINLILYGIASTNKQPNPPISYDSSVIMIILNAIIVALAIVIMVFMIVKIHKTSKGNLANEFESLRGNDEGTRCNLYDDQTKKAKCLDYYTTHAISAP